MRPIRLGKAAGELNVGIRTLVDFLSSRGINVELNPNNKLTPDQYELLVAEFKGIRSGTKLWVKVIKKIEPGVIVVAWTDQIGSILNLRDISRNAILAERIFREMQLGSQFRVQVTDVVNEQWFRCKLIDYKSDGIDNGGISSLKIGQVVTGVERGALFSNIVYELEDGVIGLLNREQKTPGDLFISRKDIDHEILYLSVKQSADQESDEESEKNIQDEDIFIARPEFKDWESFVKSKYFNCATSDELEILEHCYSVMRNPQAPAVTPQHPIKLYFEFNSSAWEFVKACAIAIGSEHNENFTMNEAEKFGLGQIEKENYWVHDNSFHGKERLNIFNEKYSIVAQAEWMENDLLKFKVIHFNEGRKNKIVGKSKRFEMGNGAQLLNGIFQLIDPGKSYSADFDKHHAIFFKGLKAKSEAERIINSLKHKISEILKAEGKSLKIFQKYLDYEVQRIKEEQPPAIPLILNGRVPNTQGLVSYELDSEIFDALMIQNSIDDDVIHVEISKKILTDSNPPKEIYHAVERGIVKGTHQAPILDLYNSDQLSPDETYFIAPLASTRALDNQKTIIRQFLNGEIDVDHIEQLFTNPEAITTAKRESVQMNNPILDMASKNSNVGKQVLAVENALGNSNLFLIQGPPGTGKTTVITEIVKQLVSRGERVLVSGQTNVAVDNVLEKLISEDEIGKLRIGNKNSASDIAQAYTIDALIENYKSDLSLFAQNQQLIFSSYGSISNEELLKSLLWDYNPSILNASKKLHERTLKFLESNLANVNVGELIQAFSEWETNLRNGMSELLEPLLYLSANVTFGTCVGAGINKFLRNEPLKFNTVIIDEAGKANLSETLAAMSLGKKVILVGDHKQLPPYFDSEAINPNFPKSFPNSKLGKRYSLDEIKHALTVSFFEFLKNKEKQGLFPSENVIMLDEQHRMHPHIGEFVSKHFYQDENGSGLRMGADTLSNTLNVSEKYQGELIFFDTSKSMLGKEKRVKANDRRSITNPFEADIIVDEILVDLEKSGINVNSVAIVAPYSAQVNLIRSELRNSTLNDFKNVEVATLDSFQGKEFDVIIFSFTRSMPKRWSEKNKVGFLDDSRRLNVAFSRAKKKLIMVGDSDTLTNPKRHDETLFPFSVMFSGLVDTCKDSEKGSFHLRSGGMGVGVLQTENIEEEPLSDEEIALRKKEVLSNIKVNQVLEGRIKNIVSYGAFVDLGGVDGLIHITDLSWGRVNHPEEIVELDQKLNVIILDFDDEKKRIALGLKQLQPHPWDTLDVNLKVGDKVKGKVVVLPEYGAFVEIAAGIEGLIHISEMSWSQRKRPAKDFLNIGDEVEAVILTLDREERKMSLGLKQLMQDPWGQIETRFAVGTKHSAKVRNFTNFGVFVELEEGLDGLIHKSEISWNKNIKHPSEYFNVGDELEVVVLDIDKKKRNISLGRKQLEENIWEIYKSSFSLGSIHEGTIIGFKNKSGIVSLYSGVEAICPEKHMKKKSGANAKVDDILKFKIIDFDKSGQRIILSHTATFENVENKRKSQTKTNIEDLKKKFNRKRL